MWWPITICNCSSRAPASLGTAHTWCTDIHASTHRQIKVNKSSTTHILNKKTLYRLYKVSIKRVTLWSEINMTYWNTLRCPQYLVYFTDTLYMKIQPCLPYHFIDHIVNYFQIYLFSCSLLNLQCGGDINYTKFIWRDVVLLTFGDRVSLSIPAADLASLKLTDTLPTAPPSDIQSLITETENILI